jgi:hypothetical protein
MVQNQHKLAENWRRIQKEDNKMEVAMVSGSAELEPVGTMMDVKNAVKLVTSKFQVEEKTLNLFCRFQSSTFWPDAFEYLWRIANCSATTNQCQSTFLHSFVCFGEGSTFNATWNSSIVDWFIDESDGTATTNSTTTTGGKTAFVVGESKIIIGQSKIIPKIYYH